MYSKYRLQADDELSACEPPEQAASLAERCAGGETVPLLALPAAVSIVQPVEPTALETKCDALERSLSSQPPRPLSQRAWQPAAPPAAQPALQIDMQVSVHPAMLPAAQSEMTVLPVAQFGRRSLLQTPAVQHAVDQPVGRLVQPDVQPDVQPAVQLAAAPAVVQAPTPTQQEILQPAVKSALQPAKEGIGLLACPTDEDRRQARGWLSLHALG